MEFRLRRIHSHIKWIKVDKPDEYQMINLLSERLPRCRHEAVGIWTARLPAAMNPSEPRAPSLEPGRSTASNPGDTEE
jgi:hypothetical protein